MSKQLLHQTLRRAYWLPAWQFLVMIMLSALWGIAESARDGLSFFCGGAVSFIPMWYLACRLISLNAARQAKKILARFYRAEIIKLFITGILFVVILRQNVLPPMPFILGFVCAQLSILLTPVLYWFDIKRQR